MAEVQKKRGPGRPPKKKKPSELSNNPENDVEMSSISEQKETTVEGTTAATNKQAERRLGLSVSERVDKIIESKDFYFKAIPTELALVETTDEDGDTELQVPGKSVIAGE